MKKTIIIIIIVVILGALGLVLFGFGAGQNDSNTPISLQSGNQVTSGVSETADVVAADIVQALSDLQVIRLDDSVFQHPAFYTLQDISIQIDPASRVGRPNPYAPIGTDVGAPVTTVIINSTESVNEAFDQSSPVDASNDVADVPVSLDSLPENQDDVLYDIESFLSNPSS